MFIYVNKYKFLTDGCTGGSKKEMRECCSVRALCELGQGDCDHDNECAGDLVCGINNCGSEFLWSKADCCMKKPGNCL